MTRFYRLFAVIYQIICFCGLSGICCGYPNLLAQSTARYAFEHPQMGTTFRIVVFAPGETQARLAAKKAFDRIDTLNSHMSDYIPESEVSRLTAHPGQWQPVSDDLWEVLVRAQKISRISKGVFDISVGPLTRLWRRAMRQQEMPPQAQIEKVRQAVNYRHVRLRKKDHSVMLLQPDMKLDLGIRAKDTQQTPPGKYSKTKGCPSPS
ncbi:MAG: FAD:protein FMN transferase [Bacteroidia bacterium]